MTMVKKPLRCLVIGLLTACGAPGEAPSVGEVRDSAGVTIISSALRESVVVDSLLVRLGTETNPLGFVTAGLLLNDSIVALVDQYEEGVSLYSIGAGRPVGRIGGYGDGPGELRSVAGFFRYDQDAVILANLGVSRAEVLGSNGRSVRSLRRSWAPLGARSGSRVRACCDLLGVLSDGRLLLGGPDAVPVEVGPPVDALRPFYVWNPARAVAPEPVAAIPSGRYEPGSSRSGPRYDRIHFNTEALAVARDSFVVLSDGRYRSLDFIDAGGEPRVRTRVSGPRREVDPQVTRSLLQRIEDEIARVGPDVAEAGGFTWWAMLSFPDSMPSYTTLLAPADQVWAGFVMEAYLGIPSTYDAFRSNGRYLGTVTLPPGTVVLDVRADRILVKRLGDADQTLVEVWTVRD